GCGAVAVLLSWGERWREEHVAEYFALLAAAGAGMAFFVQASNLMTLFLGLEWFSISLYVLCAIDIDLIGSLEAGLKYLIVGAVTGAPTPVTAFMASATKVAALVVSYRLHVTVFPGDQHLWTWAIAGIACASLAVGNIAALVQRNVKRLLAYSSVSHAGFMLI